MYFISDYNIQTAKLQVDLEEIPLPVEELPIEAEISRPIGARNGDREWDRGKLSHMKWIKTQRDEREDEFKPPSFYYDS